jgi:hypothetical protein
MCAQGGHLYDRLIILWLLNAHGRVAGKKAGKAIRESTQLNDPNDNKGNSN